MVENKQEEKKELATITGYSFEDLPSDEIGFYLALKFGDVDPSDVVNGENLEARKWLADKCGFPVSIEDAKAQSGEAYKAFGGIVRFLKINLKNWDTWGSPLLCEIEGICESEPKSWPPEFTEVTPTSAKRNGLWWFYSPHQDGELVNIKGNLYYLK